MEWIKCKDRLPDSVMPIDECWHFIVAVNFGGRPVTMANTHYYLNGKWYDGSTGMPEVREVTHWMELPEPPTDITE